MLVLSFAVTAGATSSGDEESSSDNDSIVLQDEADDSTGDEGVEDGDDSDTDEEGSSEDEPSDEETDEDEPGEEEVTEEASSEESSEGGGMGDFLATPGMEIPTVDTNLQNALAGYADYEVFSYDTTLSHADNTPSELRALGVEYLERTDPASEAGRAALALADFDLLSVLKNRYEKVEDEYAADPDEDFAPDDPDRDLNYFQSRFDPFVLTFLIPEELRPKMEGTGLDGAVDPELLELLGEAVAEANLRYIPITVVGVIQVGSMRAAMYSVFGMRTRTIAVGERPHRYGNFEIGCSQVSEDFVVLFLRSGSALVYRTFHISR